MCLYSEDKLSLCLLNCRYARTMKRETKYREKYRENPEENQYVDKVCFSPEYVCSFMFDDCKYEKLFAALNSVSSFRSS